MVYHYRKPTPSERKEIILNYIIGYSGTPIKVNYLSSKLAVSDRTIQKIIKELANYNQTKDNQNEIKNKIRACRTLLEGNGNLQEFDRFIFESIVEKVIVGGYDINGDIDPYLITFVLKIGKNVKAKPKTRKSNNGNGDADSYQSPSSDPLNSYHLPSVNARRISCTFRIKEIDINISCSRPNSNNGNCLNSPNEHKSW